MARIDKRSLSERTDPEDSEGDCWQTRKKIQMIGRVKCRMAALAVTVLMVAGKAPAAERPALPELLKALNVSGYSSVMHPPEFNGFTADGQKVLLAGLR